jgi:hypothetical protein
VKTFVVSMHLLSVFGLTIIAVTGCKTTSQTEVPQSSTVVALSGHALYQDGRSGAWRVVRVGSIIPQGSVIQTDDGPTNAIKLATGRCIRFLASPYHPNFEDDSHLTVYENSVLKLDHVTAKMVAGKRISDTRLVLLAGRVAWIAGMPEPTDYFPDKPYPTGPKLQTIKPQAGKSYYEISDSNVVIHAAQAYFYFAPRKWATVLLGTVAIEFTDTGTIKDVFNFQNYDFKTGEIAELKPNSITNSAPDYSWHYLPEEPLRDGQRFEVPHRPF